ncbi:MAG: MOSC domain-containing protein [Pseudomonadota bacterium]
MEPVVIADLFAGQVETRWPGKASSAIRKLPVEGRHHLSFTGLSNDAQADLDAHGGFEKALHHYPADHYADWQSELGENVRFRPGGFGENLSTNSLTETRVCIGDVFRIGSACLQISQGRQPCWKLAEHTKLERMAFLVRKSLRTGWYYRVLEEGEIAAGDLLTLEERPNPDWTVQAVTQAYFNPKIEVPVARELAGLPHLFQGWKDSFLERAL